MAASTPSTTRRVLPGSPLCARRAHGPDRDQAAMRAGGVLLRYRNLRSFRGGSVRRGSAGSPSTRPWTSSGCASAVRAALPGAGGRQAGSRRRAPRTTGADALHGERRAVLSAALPRSPPTSACDRHVDVRATTTRNRRAHGGLAGHGEVADPPGRLALRERLEGPSRCSGERQAMPHIPDLRSHDAHDLELVAAFAAGDAAGPGLETPPPWSPAAASVPPSTRPARDRGRHAPCRPRSARATSLTPEQAPRSAPPAGAGCWAPSPAPSFASPPRWAPGRRLGITGILVGSFASVPWAPVRQRRTRPGATRGRRRVEAARPTRRSTAS